VSQRLFLATYAVIALTTASAFAQTPPQGSAGSTASDGQPVPGWANAPAAPQGGQQPGPAPQAGQAPPSGQATTPPSGLVTVVPGVVVTTFYAVRPVDMTASNLMRTEVYNLQDEHIGRIEDLVIGGGREVAAVVVGVGGFLGLGQRYAALPPDKVVLMRSPTGGMRAVVDATRDSLRNSPEFKFEGNVGR
jgi:hypothetical protein